MGFVEREIDRIRERLNAIGEDHPDYGRLYAAQQALAWALEPAGFRSPYDHVFNVTSGAADPPLAR